MGIFWKTVWQSILKLNIFISYDSVIYSQAQNQLNADICLLNTHTRTLRVTPFILGPNWKLKNAVNKKIDK